MEFVALIWKVVSLPLWIWNDLQGNWDWVQPLPLGIEALLFWVLHSTEGPFLLQTECTSRRVVKGISWQLIRIIVCH